MSRQHITLLLIQTQITVSNPIRILHTVVTFSLRPEHRIDFACRIPTFEHLDKSEVIATREQINGHNGIGINPLIRHVAVVLNDVAGSYVKFHPIVQEIRRITESKIKTVITIVGNNALGVDRRHRKEGLVLLRTGRKGDRIGEDQSCIKEIFRFIIGAGSVIQLRSPAKDGRTSVFPTASRPVAVLEFRKHERTGKLGIAVHRHLQLAYLSALGSNNNRTIGSITTVECSCCGTRQYGDTFDVVRINVGNALRSTP